MGADSKIEWTTHTFNMWRGCTKVSAGCAHCYAETMSGRNPSTLGVWGPNGSRVVAAEAYWKQPIKWNKAAAAAGERHRVFCASMADVFEGEETMPGDSLDAVETARERLWNLIEATPALDWLLLTKRPRNIMHLVPETWRDAFPANVWIGTSVEDQAAADERIPHLLEVPARVRFLSMEPLLGAVTLDEEWLSVEYYVPPWELNHGDDSGACDEQLIHWIIVGGESGSAARPMHPAWVRSLRDQAQADGAAFFFKQWGEWLEYGTDAAPGAGPFDPSRLPRHAFDDGTAMYRVGKKAAGRLLDGVEHSEVPL